MISYRFDPFDGSTRLARSLQTPNIQFLTKELVETELALLRAVAGPEIDPETVHVFKMRAANTERDYYYSKFTPNSIGELGPLMIGRPLMIGHRWDQAPTGRIFKAERVLNRQKGKPEADSYELHLSAYVPRDAAGDAVMTRIKTGVYRDVSVSWSCVGSECNICNKRVNSRDCPHWPGEVYEQGGIADFSFSGITRAYETSIVFSGGQKNTQLYTEGHGRVTTDGRLVPPGEYDPADLLRLVSRELERTTKRSFDDEALGVRDHSMADVLIDMRQDLQRGRTLKTANPMRASVQTVIASKERFESMEAAAHWTRDHDFRADSASDAGNAYQFKQFDAAGSRIIALDQGVQAMIADPQPLDQARSFNPFSREQRDKVVDVNPFGRNIDAG